MTLPVPMPEPLQEKGPVSDKTLPRFVSLRDETGYARRGPSWTQRIDWVYTAQGLPLAVIAEYDHWRLVRDHEGKGGWMHRSILSNSATALILQDQEPLFERPDPTSLQKGVVELNAIVSLDECQPEWCKISAQGQSGWVRRMVIWGVLPEN